MAARPCPACGRSSLRPWRAATPSDPQLAGAGPFALLRCADCGSAATVGDAPDRALMYEGGTYAPARGGARRLLAPLRGLAERDRVRFSSHLDRGSRVLEVGAGDGKLVAAMRAAGLDAHGIDPSPAACAAAAAIGAPVEAVGVDEAELPAGSEDAVVIWHALEHFDDPARGAGAGSRLGPRRRRPDRRRPQSRSAPGPDRRRPLVSSGRARATAPTSPRPAPARCSARTGFEVERVRHLLVEQNPLGMWQTLLNRLTAQRDFAFRALKRDLEPATAGERARDLAVTAVAGPLLAPVAVAAELAAGLGAARRLDRRPGARGPMSAPEASVIVPTLGGERLGRMLASVASPDHETIVVDNGSGGSVAAASAGLPGAEVVELDHNVGYTRAINLGVRRAAASGSSCSTTTASATRASSRRSRRRSTRRRGW